MLYATKNKIKIKAIPNGIGYCPYCKQQLIPKCGMIKVWHWAHKANYDCDSWSEGETIWHINWKKVVKPENCEVIITRGNKTHRADIVNRLGRVIELQHSSISLKKILERQDFYKFIYWLFDARKFKDNLGFRKKDGYWNFRWYYPHKSQSYCRGLFWDFGDGSIFKVKKLYGNTPCGGWGYFLDKKEFINKYLL